MKSQRDVALSLFLGVLLAAGLIAVLIWGNYRYTSRNGGGNDFLVHWMGTQSFLRDGLSPYSDEVALRIQNMVYGRPAQQGEHELRVAYPLYSIFVFMPFALFNDFNLARAIWMAALEIGLIALASLCLRMTKWKPKPITLGLFLLFSVFWYHAMRPLILGNAVILVILMIVGAFLAIRSGNDELAGLLFAFSTIKPQVVFFLFIFVVIWGVGNKRYKLIGWMLGVLVLLVGVSTLLLPDWILQNIREVIRYPGYNPPGTLSSALGAIWPGMGNRLGAGISGLVGALMLLEWWFARKANYRHFLWTANFTLLASQWVGMQTDPGNFIILFPGLVLVFGVWIERWHRAGQGLIWTSMFFLFVGIWAIFLRTVEYSYQPIQSPIMFIPLPLFMFIAIYWVRWWAIRPPNVWMDTLTLKR